MCWTPQIILSLILLAHSFRPSSYFRMHTMCKQMCDLTSYKYASSLADTWRERKTASRNQCSERIVRTKIYLPDGDVMHEYDLIFICGYFSFSLVNRLIVWTSCFIQICYIEQQYQLNSARWSNLSPHPIWPVIMLVATALFVFGPTKHGDGLGLRSVLRNDTWLTC